MDLDGSEMTLDDVRWWWTTSDDVGRRQMKHNIWLYITKLRLTCNKLDLETKVLLRILQIDEDPACVIGVASVWHWDDLGMWDLGTTYDLVGPLDNLVGPGP